MMKKWLLIFLTSIVVCYAGLFLIQKKYVYLKNITDYKVSFLKQLHYQTFDTVIFGSSITYGGLGFDIIKYPNILNMTSVANVTAVGHYFSLKRFLANNNQTKTVYLFFMPEMVGYEFSGEKKVTYSYFNSVFRSKDEIEEIKKVYPKHNSGITYFDDMALYLDNIYKCTVYKKNCFHEKYRMDAYVNVDNILKENRVLDHSLKLNDTQKKYIVERANYVGKLHFNEKQKYFLEKMIQLCNNNNIELILALEPLPPQSHEKYIKSPSYRYVQEVAQKYALTLIDTNLYMELKNNDFFDGRHLTPNNTKVYEKMLLKQFYQGNK